MLTQCLFAPTAIRKEMDILVNDGFHTMKREVFVLNGADSMFPCCKMFTLTLYFQVLHASIVTKQTNFSQSQRQSRHHQTLMPFADFTLMYTFLKGNCHFQVGFLHIERKKKSEICVGCFHSLLLIISACDLVRYWWDDPCSPVQEKEAQRPWKPHSDAVCH